MAVNQENRWKYYGALAGAFSIVIISVLDYKNSIDLRTNPSARPDAYTASDHERFYRNEFSALREAVKELAEKQEQKHREIGLWKSSYERKIATLEAEHRIEVDQMQRHIEALQNQILYLYQEKRRTAN